VATPVVVSFKLQPTSGLYYKLVAVKLVKGTRDKWDIEMS
jgi:hypothetical protein